MKEHNAMPTGTWMLTKALNPALSKARPSDNYLRSVQRLRIQNEKIRKAYEEIRMELEEHRRVRMEKDHLIMELKEALSKARTLKGFLPICAHCKKIRDDAGCWNQIESYIQRRSDAQFSHSICPECAIKFYPEHDLHSDDK